MTPRNQALLIGGGAGLVAWGAWFYAYTKSEKAAFTRVATEAAPQIAEDAAKAYLAEHFGLTPDILRRITARTGQITTLVNAFRR